MQDMMKSDSWSYMVVRWDWMAKMWKAKKINICDRQLWGHRDLRKRSVLEELHSVRLIYENHPGKAWIITFPCYIYSRKNATCTCRVSTHFCLALIQLSKAVFYKGLNFWGVGQKRRAGTEGKEEEKRIWRCKLPCFRTVIYENIDIL